MSIAEKLTQIAENEQRVFEAGKKSQYDLMWNTIQNNGIRTNYMNAFRHWDFTDSLYPKYDINATNIEYLFNNAITPAIDLAKRFEDCGVTFNTRNCTSFQWTFYNSKFTRLPKIHFTNTAKAVNTFYSMPNLATLEISVVDATTYSSTFNFDSALENLTIEGTIGQNGFDVQWSTKLNKASITSVINALSSTTSGLSITLSKTAVNKAFGINVDDETTYPEGSEYYTLRHSKENWTINYM